MTNPRFEPLSDEEIFDLLMANPHDQAISNACMARLRRREPTAKGAPGEPFTEEHILTIEANRRRKEQPPQAMPPEAATS